MRMSETETLESYIRDIPDFPKPGIIFKDITPLLGSARAFDASIDRLARPFREEGITKVAGIESRGFIFGACVARELGCGFVPIRKPGKLPWSTRRHEYKLEYGTDALEIHLDAIHAGDRVLIVDDVLATGGTAAAAASLIRHFEAAVSAFSCVIELDFLNGRSRLDGIPVHSLLRFA